MWKPTNPNSPTPSTPEPQRPAAPAPTTSYDPAPATAPRNATLNTTDQATIGKSLVIKGEVTGSESLYIDGRVEGSINLPGNRVTVGKNGVVNANINAREVVVLGKVRGNLTASDRVDIRTEGSLTGDVVAQRISSKMARSSRAVSIFASRARRPMAKPRKRRPKQLPAARA